MDKQDWYHMGTQIGDLIQSAIDSQDFKQLNQSITDAINETVNLLQKNVQDGIHASSESGQEKAGSWRRAYEEALKSARAFESAAKKPTSEQNMRKAAPKKNSRVTKTEQGYGRVRAEAEAQNPLKNCCAAVGRVMGYGLAGLFGSLALVFGGISCFSLPMAVPALICLGVGVGFWRIGWKSSRFRKRLKLQKEYEQPLEMEEPSELSEEIRKLLEEGQEFIVHIQECNDALPGETISDKLDRLEAVVTKIFAQTAKRPKSAPDLHKMMSYYLPITRKLVDAYRDLEEQQIDGENIAKTKKEIEDSLDTVNTAFENLLDRFFEETAWDISSDITVLHTMMAQDGLMDGDFPGKNA